ncbi:hypothetical protein FA09DRAFT_262191 [Tilletiopsis washingtonensis]|uniref:Uncharacterized protein n=1 Tax=Tilletiopsis washingtonensis TaxID=58919 RepID=A0A316Z9E1_9BASI|nr:hypothetical protein FA09DRAFT_262191 [Tilletiopsis washingtonensis]PWN98407.1 hypothetical protein FA09DRAFT_262191 [Tilletiopsis washingtonensis]
MLPPLHSHALRCWRCRGTALHSLPQRAATQPLSMKTHLLTRGVRAEMAAAARIGRRRLQQTPEHGRIPPSRQGSVRAAEIMRFLWATLLRRLEAARILGSGQRGEGCKTPCRSESRGTVRGWATSALRCSAFFWRAAACSSSSGGTQSVQGSCSAQPQAG